MQRLRALRGGEVTGKTRALYGIITGKMGAVPNMMRTMANSPAALESYLSFSTALEHSGISTGLKELIAISTANANGSDYCNSAHTYMGHKSGLDQGAIDDARSGRSDDPRVEAALVFARQILQDRGAVEEADIKAVKRAGYTEGEIVEIIAQVSLSIFTNYMNIISATEIDFPKLNLIQH